MTPESPVEDRNTWIVGQATYLRRLAPHFEVLGVDDLTFARCTDGRFAADKCMVKTNQYAFLLDGVLLNKAELYIEFECKSVSHLIPAMIARLGVPGALSKMSGVFSGVYYDRERRDIKVFGNQSGESAAFEYIDSTTAIYSNSFDLLMRVLIREDVSFHFDEHAAQVMLTYGFMVDDHTFSQEICRIGPGRFSSFNLETGESVKDTYWKLKVHPHHRVESIDCAVAKMDELFRKSVARCFEKDLEYGYRQHLVDISAGLDARMTNVVARDLGYTNFTNMTYSQWDSDEAKHSIALSTKMGNQCLYMPLDSGSTLLNPERNLRLNSGMAYYAGITGGTDVLSVLNFSRFGLEHTGQVGGAIVGTYATSKTRRIARSNSGAYSSVHAYEANLLPEDEELFLMNTRAFRGSTSTHLLRQHFTYAVSPFTCPAFMEFMFGLPLEWRLNHRMYILWLKNYYPEALEVPTSRLLRNDTKPLRNGLLFAKKGASWVRRRLTRIISKFGIELKPTSNGMNPLDLWGKENPEVLKLFADASRYLYDISISEALRASLRRSLSDSSPTADKLLAVTVITMHRLYFQQATEKN